MIDPAGAQLEPLVSWLASYLLHSTVLVCAVWLGVRLGMVRAARTQDLLWKVALLGGIVTATGATLRTALPPSQRDLDRIDVRVRVLREQQDTPRAALPWTPAVVEARSGASGSAAPCRQAAAEALRAAGRAAAQPPGDLNGMAPVCLDPDDRRAGTLALAWLTVALVVLAGHAARRCLLHRVLTAGEPAAPRTRRALERVVPEGRRAPDLRISHLVASPCVHGSTVVLPVRSEVELSDGEMEAVLAHEWGHISRRDATWMGIADVVVSVLWIQPLNRVTRAGLRRAAELVCDDWAVDRTGRAIDLVRSIWQVAEWSRENGWPQPATSLARRGSQGLSERARRILRPTSGTGRGGRGRGWGAALLLAVPLALLPVQAPRGVSTVVLAREYKLTAPAAEVASRDSLHVEVRAVRLR